MLMTLAARAVWIKGRPLCLFTLPYVLVGFAMLFVMSWTHAYDRHLYTGWRLLAEKEYTQSLDSFGRTHDLDDRAAAYRDDGLGWNYFFLSRYAEARFQFRDAVERQPDFADPYDGLGWSSYRLGDLSGAGTNFASAVQRDPWLADSWDGLAWLQVEAGHPDSAKAMFTHAIVAAPLLADAWHGSYYCDSLAGKTSSASWSQTIGQWIHSNISPQYSLIRSGQILAWILLLCGILIHSWISGIVVVAALCLGCVPISHLSHSLGGDSLNMIYNLCAMSIAVGGHYLRPSRVTWVLLLVWIILFRIVWNPVSAFFAGFGLPLFSMPFNVFLLAALMSGLALRRFRVLVPFDVAATTPSQVHRWWLRSSVAAQCWKKIASVM
jgi:hypothetical protein